MKLSVWLAGAGWTVRHLLWVAVVQPVCMVTLIYEQLLGAVRISVAMAC